MTTSIEHRPTVSPAHPPTQRMLARALAGLFWSALVLLIAGSAALLG